MPTVEPFCETNYNTYFCGERTGKNQFLDVYNNFETVCSAQRGVRQVLHWEILEKIGNK